MASVRLENDAWIDPRYDILAQLVGLGDGDFARVRCMRVWSYCTDRNEDVLAESVIDAIGKHKGFARAMVEAELAEETKRGFRVRGARGRIEWLASKRKNASKGGQRKASNRLANASESLDGRSSKSTKVASSRSAAVLPSAPAPAPAPALLCSGEEEREEHHSSSDGEARVAPPKAKRRWSRFPSDYEPGEAEAALAAELGLDLQAELTAIRDFEFKSPKSDAAATLRTWLRNSKRFTPANRNNAPRRGPAPVSTNAEFEEMLREQRGGAHA